MKLPRSAENGNEVGVRLGKRLTERQQTTVCRDPPFHSIWEKDSGMRAQFREQFTDPIPWPWLAGPKPEGRRLVALCKERDAKAGLNRRSQVCDARANTGIRGPKVYSGPTAPPGGGVPGGAGAECRFQFRISGLGDSTLLLRYSMVRVMEVGPVPSQLSWGAKTAFLERTPIVHLGEARSGR